MTTERIADLARRVTTRGETYSENELIEAVVQFAALLAAAKKVDALSIQTEAHKELRAAIRKATGRELSTDVARCKGGEA